MKSYSRIRKITRFELSGLTERMDDITIVLAKIRE